MIFNFAWLRWPSLASASVAWMLCAGAPAFAALPPAKDVSSKPNVVKILSDAQKAMKAGRLPLAIIYLKTALAADPKNGPIRATLGRLLESTGDYEAAERELRQARQDGAADQLVLPLLFQAMTELREEQSLLEQFPEPDKPSDMTADILKARAVAYLGLGQISDAIVAIDKALKLRRDISNLFVRARIAQAEGSPAAALKLADEAIAMAPDRLDLMVFKVTALSDANDLTGALALADQVIAKFPADRSAQFARVDVLMRMNRNSEAKAVVDAALRKDPLLVIGVYYRAILLSRAGDNNSAWRIAQSLPQPFLSSQPQIALIVSRIAEAAGNSETGATILGVAIGRFHQNPDLRLELASIRLKQNDARNAVAIITPVSDTLDPAVAQQVAAIYVRSGKPSLALEVFDRLADAGKGNDAAILQMVTAETQAGRGDQALNFLATAVAEKPTNTVLASRLAADLTQRGRFADALKVADNLGRDQAYRVASLLVRGDVFFAQKKFADAQACYSQAAQANPKSQEALYGRANVLEQLGQFADASKSLGVILQLNPKNTLAYLKLAEIRIRQGQDEQARSVLNQAIRQIPNDPAPHLAMARYLTGRGDRPGALGVLDKFLKVNPNNEEGLAFLGEVQLGMGRNADAVATYRRLVALTPNDARLKILLGNALVASGDRTGAGAAVRNAIDLAPHSADVQLAQINFLLAGKDAEGAIAAARAYQKANPGTEGDLLLGDTLARAGRRDQAMVVYRKSFSTMPTSATVMKIAENSIADGDTGTAAKALTGWMQRNPQDNAVRLGYVSILMQQGHDDDAIRHLREVLKNDPNNVDGLNNLAWLMGDRDPNAAIDLAAKAMSLAPNSADVLDTLGWLKFKHAKVADSLPLLKRAHDLNPQDGEITYHLALSLDATGGRDAARLVLRALLASQVKFADLPEAKRLVQAWH